MTMGFDNSRALERKLFPLGQVVTTRGALRLMVGNRINPIELLNRHATGDWGNVPPEDARENALSVKKGFRILSSYGEHGQRLWVITEADRSVTTILLPEEY